MRRHGFLMAAALFHFLDTDVTIILLSNTNRTDLDAFADRIGRALVE